jgi:hypothetical protein
MGLLFISADAAGGMVVLPLFVGQQRLSICGGKSGLTRADPEPVSSSLQSTYRPRCCANEVDESDSPHYISILVMRRPSLLDSFAADPPSSVANSNCDAQFVCAL